jgi:hypothetical protein
MTSPHSSHREPLRLTPHAVSRRAEARPACVVVGFGWQDPHVADRLAYETSLGLDLVDVSTTRAQALDDRRPIHDAIARARSIVLG